MVELFQERYRELPAFQKMREQVEYCLDSHLSRDEFTTRMMLMAESPISWFTTCGNCSALLDENYSQAMEIERLKEDLAYAENEARDLQREVDSYDRFDY